MKNLYHHGYDANKASKLTQEARWTSHQTAMWISTTQVWSWDGGDAIVVATGHLPYATTHVVIRIGDKVTVMEGSLNTAMLAHGIDPKEYVAVAASQAAA